jgi:hypothetical protein
MDGEDRIVVVPVSAPPMVAGDPKTDSVEPSSDLGPAFEPIQLAVDDHEHVLDRIVDRGRGDAEPPEGTPHEGEVLFVHSVEFELLQ